MHMAAFLIDPLRKIRRLGGEGKIKQFELVFPGRTGKVWKEILVEVRDLVRGKSDVKDYELFRRYFDGIKFLITSIQRAIKYTNRVQEKAMLNGPTPKSPKSFPPLPATAKLQEIIDLAMKAPEVIDLTADASPVPVSLGLSDVRAVTKALSMARIRGNFKDLRAGHHRLLTLADSTLEVASQLPKDDHVVGVLERLQKNKDYAAAILPKRADVSYYGYNGSDTKLAECRSDPKSYALREAKPRSERKKAQDA
jgi:hypothetical protein